MVRHKKGFIGDFVLFFVIIFILIIVMVVVGKVSVDVNEKFGQKLGTNDTGARILDNFSNTHSNMFDWIVVILFSLFGIGTLFAGFMLDSHPALFFVAVFVFVFMLIAAAVLGNAYERFTENVDLAPEAQNMPMTSYIMQNWGFILMIYGFLLLIVIFARVKAG